MKKVLIFLTALCSSLSVAAQEPLLRDSVTNFESDGFSFSRKHFLYDENNRITAVKWFQRDEDKQWDLFNEQDTVYTATGKLQMVAHLVCDHGKTVGGYKTEYAYDASDSLESSCLYGLNEEGGFLRERREFTYDETHRLILEMCWGLVEKPDSGFSLSLSGKIEYQYDDKGRVADVLYSNYLNEDWCPARHETYAYDESDRLLVYKDYIFNWGQWWNFTRMEYIYEDCGDGKSYLTAIASDGDDSPEGWIRVGKTVETHYDYIPDFGSLLYLYEEGQWVFQPDGWNRYIEFLEDGYQVITDSYGVTRYVEVKDMSGRILYETSTTADFGNDTKTEYSYDEQGNLTEKLYIAYNGGNPWMGDKYAYTFDTDRQTLTCVHSILENGAWDEPYVEWIEFYSNHGASDIPGVHGESMPTSGKRLMDGKPAILYKGRIFDLQGRLR